MESLEEKMDFFMERLEYATDCQLSCHLRYLPFICSPVIRDSRQRSASQQMTRHTPNSMVGLPDMAETIDCMQPGPSSRREPDFDSGTRDCGC